MTACRHQLDVGAYLLGVLEPGERTQMRRHLEDCAACRADLAELAALPARLAAADLGQVAPRARPSELAFHRLAAATTDGTPRHQRPRTLLAVAAGVALALALSGTVVAVRAAQHHSPEPTGPTVVAAAAGAVHARAELTVTQTGTSVLLTLGGVMAHEQCRLVAVGRDGRRQTASTWTATYHGDASITGWLSIRPADVDRFVIETLGGRTLLVLPAPRA